MGELTIFIGSLFREMGSLSEKAAFLRSKRKLVVVQLEVVSSKVSLRWRLKILRLWQVKATVKDVVGQDEVSAKPATLERKVDEAWPRMTTLSCL